MRKEERNKKGERRGKRKKIRERENKMVEKGKEGGIKREVTEREKLDGMNRTKETKRKMKIKQTKKKNKETKQ